MGMIFSFLNSNSKMKKPKILIMLEVQQTQMIFSEKKRKNLKIMKKNILAFF